MENDLSKSVIKFQEIVHSLKSELEEYSKNHATRDDEPDKLKQEYHTKIVPCLLQLRKLNRIAKEMGEEKSEKISQFNRRLVNLKQQCDNITFEAACLKHEVVVAKKRLSPTKGRDQGDVRSQPQSGINGTDANQFDIDEIGSLDHEERLRIVDREESRRRNLQEKLAEATAETDNIAFVSKSCSNQLDRVKPHIRRLLDEVNFGDPGKTDRKD